MINTVWQGFLGFHVAFVIKRLFCIEYRVFRKKEKKKVGDAEMTHAGYCQFSGLGHDRAFWLCVATWSSMSRHGSQVAGVAGS